MLEQLPDSKIALFLAASVGFGAYAYSQKEDLFNFAVVGFAWIVVTTAWIGRALLEDRAGLGGLFLIALYVIVASTAAIKGIAYIGRSWKTAEAVSWRYPSCRPHSRPAG